MTTYYTSSDTTIGFDATTAGAMPADWTAKVGTWAVGTVNPTTGHTHSFGSTTQADGNVALLTGITAQADMDVIYAQSLISATATICPAIGVFLRADSANSNGYLFVLSCNNNGAAPSGQIKILAFKKVSGTFTLLSTTTAASTFATGDKLNVHAQCVGTTIRCRIWDGTTSAEPTAWDVSYTDSSVTAAGYAGLYYGLDTGSAVAMGVDDFIVSSIPAGITVTTPGTVTAGASMTISGTYTGPAPTGLNVQFDSAGYNAASSPTISGGIFSFTTTAPAVGTHTVTVQENNATAVTATSGNFVVNAPNVAIPPDHPDIVYSPYNWNVGVSAAVTINAGAYLRTMFSGTSCVLNFNVASNLSPLSEIWYRIDGEGPWTQAAVASAIICVMPAASLSNNDIPYHLLEMVVKSTTETQNRWNMPSATAVNFTGLTLAPGAVLLTPLSRPINILIYGDSITEGVRTLGESATNDTDRNDAMLGWAFRLGDLLGAEVGVVGFGASGIAASGSGNVPALPSSYALLYQGVARNFSPTPALVVFNEGTNDGTANAVSAMTGVLNGVIAACPGAVIAVLRPFNGNQAANLQAAIAGCANPSVCHYIDTTGVFDTSKGSDSLHLHPSGTNNLGLIAPKLAASLRPLLLGGQMPAFRGGFQRGLLG